MTRNLPWLVVLLTGLDAVACTSQGTSTKKPVQMMATSTAGLAGTDGIDVTLGAGGAPAAGCADVLVPPNSGIANAGGHWRRSQGCRRSVRRLVMRSSTMPIAVRLRGTSVFRSIENVWEPRTRHLRRVCVLMASVKAVKSFR